MLATIDLYVLLDNPARSALVANPASRFPSATPEFVLRDTTRLRVRFYRRLDPNAATLTQVDLGADAAVAFAGKASSNYVSSSDFLFYGDLTRNADDAEDIFWDSTINLNTTEFIAAFGSAASLALRCELQVTQDSDIRTVAQFDGSGVFDVIRGDEAPPSSAVPPYPSAPTANTVLGGNAAGTAWQQRTFAELRADANLPQKPIAVTGNTTAAFGETYEVFASATFTDPTPPQEGGYVVRIRNGTATIGGVGYTEGSVWRVWHSGAWSTQAIEGTVTASQISDSTTTGRAVLTAATQADGRAALGAGAVGDTLFTAATEIEASADILIGAGNLREWFERQFNAHTDTTTAGKNKRVSIAHFGDSLSGRLTGWWGYYASREFNYGGRNGGFGTNGGPFFSNPAGPANPMGAVKSLAGGATTVTNGFAIWPNGIYYDIPAGGTVEFAVTAGTVGITADLWRIAYVAEPGAATFVVEIATTSGGSWTQLGAEVNADNATQIGAVAERSTGTLNRRFVRVRNTHASAAVKVIDAYFGFANTLRGFDGIGINQGGISPASAVLTPSAIYTPIMTSLNPGLITFHFDDTLSAIESNWTALLAFMRAGNPVRSVLVIANGPHSTSADADEIATMRFFRSRVEADNIAVLDQLALLTSTAAMTAQGWNGDGVHLDERAYAYAAHAAWRELAISNRLGLLFRERALISDRLHAPEIRFEVIPGANMFSSGLADDYYFRIIGDNTNMTGGFIEMAREMTVTNKTRNAGANTTIFSMNEAVFANTHPGRLHRPNVSSETIPAGFTSLTTGVAEWTFGGKRVLRDQATAQVLRVGPFTGEASLDFPSLNAGDEATLTVTVTGVTTAGKFAVSLGWSAALEDGIVVKQAWVSGSNTVSIRVRNGSGGTIDPAGVTAYVVAMGIA